MDNREKQHKSKFLSLILRHNPSLVGIEVEEDGWVDIDILLSKIKNKCPITRDELSEIVATCEKQRYSIRENKIRANQGHSINIKINFEKRVPLPILYHGTSLNNKQNILREGIDKRNRQFVHLSKDQETARKVGARHGVPCILEIDAERMNEEGLEFFISENGVWLTDHVPIKYIKVLEG